MHTSGAVRQRTRLLAILNSTTQSLGTTFPFSSPRRAATLPSHAHLTTKTPSSAAKCRHTGVAPLFTNGYKKPTTMVSSRMDHRSRRLQPMPRMDSPDLVPRPPSLQTLTISATTGPLSRRPVSHSLRTRLPTALLRARLIHHHFGPSMVTSPFLLWARRTTRKLPLP